MPPNQINRTQLDETQFQYQGPRFAYGNEFRENNIPGFEADAVQAFEEPPPTNVDNLISSSLGFSR
jgi:hypothetical protein